MTKFKMVQWYKKHLPVTFFASLTANYGQVFKIFLKTLKLLNSSWDVEPRKKIRFDTIMELIELMEFM